MLAEDLDSLFYLPILTEALEELQQLQIMLNATQYHPEDSDSWKFIWGKKVPFQKILSNGV
jgi:hypothetical protein